MTTSRVPPLSHVPLLLGITCTTFNWSYICAVEVGNHQVLDRSNDTCFIEKKTDIFLRISLKTAFLLHEKLIHALLLWNEFKFCINGNIYIYISSIPPHRNIQVLRSLPLGCPCTCPAREITVALRPRAQNRTGNKKRSKLWSFDNGYHNTLPSHMAKKTWVPFLYGNHGRHKRPKAGCMYW
jgi:hypothetical protein